jgi:BTB/POZ domain
MLNLLKAESVLSLVHERQDPQVQINPTTSPPPTFEVPGANIIIRSSDLVDFRVHKSALALVSPFFEDLLSLPQPSDSETVDGLPVVQLSEDSELLNSLVSIIYPVRRGVPSSYEKVLFACDLPAVITNRLLQDTVPTRSVPEI